MKTSKELAEEILPALQEAVNELFDYGCDQEGSVGQKLNDVRHLCILESLKQEED